MQKRKPHEKPDKHKKYEPEKMREIPEENMATSPPSLTDRVTILEAEVAQLTATVANLDSRITVLENSGGGGGSAQTLFVCPTCGNNGNKAPISFDVTHNVVCQNCQTHFTGPSI